MKRIFLFLWFVLIQSAFAEIGINPTAKTFERAGGGGVVLVTGTGSWTATTDSNWITVFTQSGNGAGTVAYLASSNFTADTRQGKILINDKVHTVTQNGYESSISPTTADFDENGGSGSIAVTVGDGVSWSASSEVDWLEVSADSGISDGSITFTAAAYEGVQPRVGSITVAGKIFTVTQTGTQLAVKPTSKKVSYQATAIPNIGVEALAGTSWTVKSNVSWLSIVDAGRGFGDSAITIGVGENPSYLERVGTVSIGSKVFTVTQEGTPNLRLDINPKEATADASGAVGNVAVLATPDAPWTSESLAPWIIVSQGASGAGNGNIGYVVSPNTNLSPRTGQIRINPPVLKPGPDLTRGLLAKLYGGLADQSGWGRGLSDTINKPLNLTGPSFNRTNDAFSIVLDFTIEALGSIKRLLEVERSAGSYSTLYMNSSNELVFQVGEEKLTTEALTETGNYRAYITSDTSNNVILDCYGLTEGSEFELIEGNFNWGQAKDDAENRGGRLAVLNTQEKIDRANLLTDRLPSNLDMHIGLRQSNGQWEWINDEPLTDNNWNPGEPFGGNYVYIKSAMTIKWTAAEIYQTNYLLEKISTAPVTDLNNRITTAKQYSQAPFPSDIVPEDIGLSQTNKPSVGLLRDASITGISIYDRNLSEEEVEEYGSYVSSFTPEDPSPSAHFNLNGSGIDTVSSDSPASITSFSSLYTISCRRIKLSIPGLSPCFFAVSIALPHI